MSICKTEKICLNIVINHDINPSDYTVQNPHGVIWKLSFAIEVIQDGPPSSLQKKIFIRYD